MHGVGGGRPWETQAEVGVMLPQAKGCQQPLELEKARNRLSPPASRRSMVRPAS